MSPTSWPAPSTVAQAGYSAPCPCTSLSFPVSAPGPPRQDLRPTRLARPSQKIPLTLSHPDTVLWLTSAHEMAKAWLL